MTLKMMKNVTQHDETLDIDITLLNQFSKIPLPSLLHQKSFKSYTFMIDLHDISIMSKQTKPFLNELVLYFIILY